MRFRHRIAVFAGLAGVWACTQGPGDLAGLLGSLGGGAGGADVATETIGPTGGVVFAPRNATDLKGARIIVPQGTVADGQELTVTMKRLADGTDKVELDALSPLQTFDRFASYDNIEHAIHPLLAALAVATTSPRPLSPVIEFGPAGATFDPPVHVYVPIDMSLITDPGQTALVSVILGQYENGRLVGERVSDVSVDTLTGEVLFSATHFSVAQVVWDGVSTTAAGAAGLIGGFVMGTGRSLVRAWSELPDAPELLNPLVQRLLCTGIAPRMELGRLPNPATLLWFLATPGGPAAGETEAAAFERYRQSGLVNGQEAALEDWVLGQGAARGNGAVTMEDLFAEALHQSNGDLFQTLLLCHNVLRGWDGLNRVNNPNVNNGRGVAIQNAMASVPGSSDSVGDRYHFFGMALYALYARIIGTLPTRYDQFLPELGGIAERVTELTIYAEECYVSGDCLRDEFEFAFDLEGEALGHELAENVLGDLDNQWVVQGLPRAQFAANFGASLDACLTVEITGNLNLQTGQYASLQATSPNGQAPVGVRWVLGGQELQTGPKFYYKFDQPGSYVLTAYATDARLVAGHASVTLNVTAAPAPGAEWVVWYTGNVSCWSAPRIYVTTRTDFNAWWSTAQVPGGGIDYTNPLQKVEMQGGFASQAEATAWICPQFTARLWHYWCTVHYNIGGKYWTMIGFDCPNLSSLPWEQ
jgi:hypothetical protein